MPTLAPVRPADDSPPLALREHRADDSEPRLVRRRSTEAGSATDAGAGSASRTWWILAVLAVAVFVALHLEVARSAVAPRTPWDEIHPLQIARMLAGDDSVAPLSGSGYYPGWAILLTPVWWFTQDPPTVYRIAIILGHVIAAATLVPLTLIGRRLWLSTPQALAAAALVMCLPGRVGAADYAMSEQPLMLFYACAALGAFALWKRPTWWALAGFVASVAAAYLTHTRALALVLTAVVWLLFFTRRSVVKALVGVALLVVCWRGVGLISSAINGRILIAGPNKSDLAGKALSQAEPGLIVRLLSNQAWEQVVGTAGLFALGVVVIVLWTLRELRTLHLGPGAFLFGLTLSTVAVSVLWWNRPSILWDADYVRLDAWLYSRYIDHVATLVALVALSVLIRRVSGGIIAIALAIFAAGAAIVVFWVAPHVPLWGVISTSSSAINSWQGMFPDEPFHRPLTPTFTNANRFWVWASLSGLIALGALLLLRRFPRTVFVVLLVAATTLSLTGNLDQRRSPPTRIQTTLAEVDRAAGSDQPLPVDMDFSCKSPALTKHQMLNWAGFWYAPREVRLADPPDGDPFRSDLVISCPDGSTMKPIGARVVKGGPNYSFRLWVRPGELQDELDRAGMLKD